jgi:hypothetical protein
VVVAFSISHTCKAKKAFKSVPMMSARVMQNTIRNRSLEDRYSVYRERIRDSDIVTTTKKQLRNAYRTSRKKNLWFLNPTQFAIHGQWWSIRRTQDLHARQWWQRSGL